MFMVYSPESKLDDIRSLMDSYALEVWKGGLLFIAAPLHWCKYGDQPMKPFDGTFPAIDTAVELRLVRWEPPQRDDILEGIRERQTRWPFFVNSPMAIKFALADQWWEYHFSPGKMYKNRRFEGTV